MKKIMSLFIALVMILSVMAVPVSANDYVETKYGKVYLNEGELLSDYFVYVVENNEVSIVRVPDWSYEEKELVLEEIVIPDEIDGQPVTKISFDLFYYDGAGYGEFIPEDERPEISLVIGKNVREIPGMVTSGFNITYSVKEGNEYFAAYDGGLYSKDKTVLYGYPGAKVGELTVPDGVKKINHFAFAQMDAGATKVNLPDGLTHIGDGAFQSTFIKEINIPDSVVEIGIGAFERSSDIKSMIVPNGVTVLNEMVFMNCYFESLYLPKSITNIKNEALLGSIKNIYYEGSEEEWNAIERGEYAATPADTVVHFNSKLEDIKSESADVFEITDSDTGVIPELKLSLNTLFAGMNSILADSGVDLEEIEENYDNIVDLYYALYEENISEYSAILPVAKEACSLFENNFDGLITAMENETEDYDIIEGVNYLFDVYEFLIRLECLVNGKGKLVEEVEEALPSYDYFDFDAEPVAFSDVPENQWYAETVKKASASGIIKGMGNGKFEPDSDLTVAEAMTLAAKVNAVYYDRMDVLNSYMEQFSGDGIHWAFGISQYCKDFGLIFPWTFEFDDECSRYMMGVFFFYALPEENLTSINDISKAPEQLTQNEFEIGALFTSGIMIGDNSGFRLESNITRAEAAALIYRVADPEARVKVD